VSVLKSVARHGLVLASLVLVVTSLTLVKALSHPTGASSTVGGLSVFVGYAEDKEIETPNPASFPVPWAGAPNTTFLGGTVPGQTACGTLTTCYDAGAIRLDNPGPTAVTVTSVSVDDHSSIAGGKVFTNLWGSFMVPAGQSVILTENPPANNPGYDNFDTSGFPASCTPLTVAPSVTISIGGVTSTLVDSTHVLDTGATDTGSCSPQHNESIPWRPIGVPGSDAATLTLGPSTVTAPAGHPITETATLLDGGGQGIPNAAVGFTVTSGPDAGKTGTVVTDGNGHAPFTYAGTQGEDVLIASVTTVGTFQSNPARVMWIDGSATGWSGSDIGNPTPAGSQSFDPNTATWTIGGGGAGIGGATDQFHFISKTLAGDGGISAHVTTQADTGANAKAGVMLRASTAAGSPYYAAFETPAGGIAVQDRSTLGGATSTVVNPGTGAPAYLWIVRSGPTLTTYSSSDGTTWAPVAGSTVTLSLGPTVLEGMAMTSGSPGVLGSTTMDSIAVTPAPPAPQPAVPCPSPFACADIGSPALAGSQSFDPNTGTWTIKAGGADITGTSDQFRFVSQTLSGDGNVSAHVITQTNSSSNAKAGVMVRASTDPGSPYYAVLVSPGAGIKVQERSTPGGNTTKLANPTGTVPTYLEVTRSGNSFTASTSVDGSTWTPIAGSTFAMAPGPTLLAGLAVTSHNAGQLGTVTMDTVKGA
jgi:hypothetical protein